MLGIHDLALFVVSGLLLNITPGPDNLLIIGRSTSQGARAGLLAALGIACGCFVHVFAAAFGLSAILATSAAAFTVVKLAGAGYLVWLGIQALRGGGPVAPATSAFAAPQYRRIFRDGFIVALLNPKTALFFAAFLPQFIDPAGSAIAQSVAYGAAFVAIAACTDASYALAAGAAAPMLARAGRSRGGAARYVVAGAYFGLAAYTLALGPRDTPPKG